MQKLTLFILTSSLLCSAARALTPREVTDLYVASVMFAVAQDDSATGEFLQDPRVALSQEVLFLDDVAGMFNKGAKKIAAAAKSLGRAVSDKAKKEMVLLLKSRNRLCDACYSLLTTAVEKDLDQESESKKSTAKKIKEFFKALKKYGSSLSGAHTRCVYCQEPITASNPQ